VRVDLTVELGRCPMRLRDVLELGPGAIVRLDRTAGAPVDVFVNNEAFARGELIAVDDSYAVRITEVTARS